MVFDACSNEKGFSSLNDRLSPVNNVMDSLLTILSRFRSNKTAVIADIEGAIAEEDRDSHRFLLHEATSRQVPEIAECHMTRVTFGTTSSSIVLSAVVQHCLTLYDYCHAYSTICSKLRQLFYLNQFYAFLEVQLR